MVAAANKVSSENENMCVCVWLYMGDIENDPAAKPVYMCSVEEQLVSHPRLSADSVEVLSLVQRQWSRDRLLLMCSAKQSTLERAWTAAFQRSA